MKDFDGTETLENAKETSDYVQFHQLLGRAFLPL